MTPHGRFRFFAGYMNYFVTSRLAVGCAAIALFSLGEPLWGKNPDFLIDSWQDHEGIPESSALAVAQTPDGYLWVGSPEGLMRFNGTSFTRAADFSIMVRLTGVVPFLQTDRSGRMWADGGGRLALYDHGRWRGIWGTNVSIRSVAEDINGKVLIGGFAGQLYTVKNYTVENLPSPVGVKPSGVFCVADAKDGGLWLANKGFIGRLTPSGWLRLGPSESISKPLLAGSAHNGGLWVYTPGKLQRYQSDGTVINFIAPDLDQPRDLMEDRSGTIWIATITSGLIHFRPGGGVSAITDTNGLSHTAVRCVVEDLEGNIWAGGSLNGLNRLKPRQFVTIGREDGLSGNIVRTIVERAPGQMVVGTHGGGLARIENGKVTAEHPVGANFPGQYVWSLVQDRKRRLWIGTFSDGVLVEEKGVRRTFPLPADMGRSIACLLEDSSDRIWAGGPAGLVILGGDKLVAGFTNSPIAGFAVTALAEDAKSGSMWVGTYAHGVFSIDTRTFTHINKLSGLPGERVSSLTFDKDGHLWIGVLGRGLVCVHDGKTTLVGAPQGLPVQTIGSMLDDGHGFFWLGTTRGILRVASAELHRVAQEPSRPVVFNSFDTSDGLGSEYCAEGYQPTALRDTSGHLWFGTDRGVVTVDPAQLRLNTNPPPVMIERVSFTDRSGSNHVCLKPLLDPLVIPAGSSELGFDFAALSLTAPEKVIFKYQLEGANDRWVPVGNHRELHFRVLPPGSYKLHLAAANNDGVWNETGATLAFNVRPFFWQTFWFRLLASIVVVGGGGFAVRRMTRRQFQRRIEQLQQQRRLEQERARLATVMENTSDLVVFADHKGGVIHINAAGRKLIGLAENEKVRELQLGQLQPGWAADVVASEAIPAARQHGTWEGESALRHSNGREIPVSLVLIAHKDADGQDVFISAIARDITERKFAEAELKRREKYFRSLIEHATDSITVINPNAIITYQSPSGERILGYPVESMTGRSFFELVHPEDLAKAQAGLDQSRAQLDVPVTLTVRLRHQDDSWRNIEAVGTCIETDTGEKQIILNARDLTANLKLEEQFRQAQKMEAVGQLAGGVAHDFNNILSSLLMQTELLGMSEHLSAEVREGLQQICADTRRAADLTRQLLLFSRRQVMRSRVLDLNEVVMDLAKMLQRVIREDVRLQLHLHPTPLMTHADAGMLDQVLMNLAVNARDAMTKGGRLRIETSEAVVDASEAHLNPEAAPGRYVCLSVSDTGGGIPPEILPRIFEPFFTTKEAGKGTGLGLATVFGIVKQHQGWIKLDNSPGQGVTFHIFLPASTAATADPAQAEAQPKPRGGAETILLVEDELAVRKPTRRILERHGYKVLEAVDGLEALKLWEEHRSTVALLLTDLVMPGGLGGHELGRRLEAERPGLKVVFASGYSADIAGRDLQLQPGEAFIQKPFATDHLLETIRRCLDA